MTGQVVPPPPRTTGARTRSWWARGLIVLGVVQALCVAVPFLISARLRDEVSRRLEGIGGQVLGSGVARVYETRREVRRTGIIGRIEIPRIGLSEPVIEELRATSMPSLLRNPKI